MLASSVLYLAVLIAPSISQETHGNEILSDKRAPMGFHGMRGKKEFSSEESDDFSKRALMGFQGMRGKKDSIGPDIADSDNLLHEDFDKRAKMMGFQGMRGKKEYLVPNFDEYSKRAPMGFQGMRGKKDMYEEDFYKRAAAASMGFHGMRGKKSLEELLDDIEKRAIMGFQGMRGKKASSYLLDYPEDYEEKRALKMGFQGMRGKRNKFVSDWQKRSFPVISLRDNKIKEDDVTLLDELNDLEKRALMGFQGVRGKKDNTLDSYYEYIVDPAVDFEPEPMGFQGMDSMNSMEDSDCRKNEEDFDKREPITAATTTTTFLPLRGKRSVQGGGVYGAKSDEKPLPAGNPAAGMGYRRDEENPFSLEKRNAFGGYFGVKNKKEPRWEFRGKFVGVRGKKWSSFNEDALSDDPWINSIIDRIERNNLERRLTSKDVL